MTENHGTPAGNQPPQYGGAPGGGQPQYQGGAPGHGNGGDLATPKPVKNGATLVYISAALSVIGLILGLFTLTGSQEYKDLQDQGQGAYAWGVFAGAAFFALIKVVLQILSARAATKGKNWGRIVLIVLAVLSLLGLLAPSADVSGILSIISTLLLVIGTIMMLTGRGGAWFKEIKQRRQQNMMR